MHVLKIHLLVVSLFMLTACTSINPMKSGDYIISKNDSSLKSLGGRVVTQLQIDAKKKSAVLQTDVNKKLYIKATVLDKNKWIKDCHTNTSHELLETWQLTHASLKQTLYLYSACFNGNEVYLSDSLERDSFQYFLLKSQ